MTTEPLDDDYRMPLNPKPRYCSQCDNEVGEDETLCLECRECREEEEIDRELEREISEMLMACADWFGRNPQIKADPRAWQHLAVYWPNTEMRDRPRKINNEAQD